MLIQKEFDPDLKHGPRTSRSCTDIICCFLFIAFIATSGFVLIDSRQKGDLSRIGRPYDYDGRACGYVNGTNDLTEYKYLFFDLEDITEILPNSVCVKSCPTDSGQQIECYPTKNVPNCGDLVSYDSFKFLGGFCLPAQDEFLQQIGSLFSGFNLESIADSIWVNRYIILSFIGVAFLLSYFFTLFLQYCTWLVVAISIIGIYVVGGFLSILCWRKYKSILEQKATSDPQSQDNLNKSANVYKWAAIGMWIILTLFTLIICCLFSRIVLAVNVIQAAADFVTDYKAVIFVPILMVLLIVGYILFWAYGLAVIYSTGTVYHDSGYPWGLIETQDMTK